MVTTYSARTADALREYLLRHYAAEHLSGKVCLFQGRKSRALLAKRHWVTQTEAATTLGLRQGAIAALVARKVLVGQVHPAGLHGRSVGLVSRQSVESLHSDLQTALGVRSTARRLGIQRHAVLDLIHADVLPRAVRTAQGWQIPVRAVQDIEALCSSLPRLSDLASRWVSLCQATRVAGPSGLSMSGLLRLIESGVLRARMAQPEKKLHGIAVSCADLAAVRKEARNQSEPAADWSLHRAARSLFPQRPVKAYVLKRWIRVGLLRARQEGVRTILSAEEIRRFRAEYCLAREAAQALGIARSTLSRWEAQGRITPVYGKRVTAHAGFSLYRREDLRRLRRLRSPPQSKTPPAAAMCGKRHS